MPNTPRTPTRRISEEYSSFEDKNRYKKKFRSISDDDMADITKKLSFDGPEFKGCYAEKAK